MSSTDDRRPVSDDRPVHDDRATDRRLDDRPDSRDDDRRGGRGLVDRLVDRFVDYRDGDGRDRDGRDRDVRDRDVRDRDVRDRDVRDRDVRDDRDRDVHDRDVRDRDDRDRGVRGHDDRDLPGDRDDRGHDRGDQAAVRAAAARTGDAGAAGSAERAVAQRSGSGTEKPATLIAADRQRELQARWTDIKGDFVEEPRYAVRRANELVGEVLDDLENLFRTQQRELEHGLDDDRTTTEDLRIALGRYRSFFDRLISF